MSAKKFAISVPEDVMEQVDRAALRRGVTRSRFIVDTLRVVAAARSDREISKKIDRVFADAEVASEQRDTVAAFHGVRSRKGTEW